MTEPLELRFPPDPEHLRTLRHHVRAQLDRAGITRDSAEVVVLVLDELVTNAIEHADPYRADGEHLRVRIELRGADVAFEFEDPDVPERVVAELARSLHDGGSVQPPADAERGRGLFLVARNVRGLRVARRSGGGLHLSGHFTDVLG